MKKALFLLCLLATVICANAFAQVNVETTYDSSASPVHIQIKKCTTDGTSDVHSEIDCRVDPEFALVGGSAATLSAGKNGGSPFLTESRPFDARTWRASSADHMITNWHSLVVYAIGMRLDGVNTQTLRDSIQWEEQTVSYDSPGFWPQYGDVLLSGGGRADSSGDASRFLIGTYPDGNGWKTKSADHYLNATGPTTVWALTVEDQIIEGFGKLEIQTVNGNVDYQSAGFSNSTAGVSDGWAMIGMGVKVENQEQPGRMVTTIRPDVDGRGVSVYSRDHVWASAGTTQAFLVQARKMPKTHGLCNPGASLLNYIDPCVNSICSQRWSCCSTSWDATCVQMVESVCGRTCEGHSCYQNAFEPEEWQEADGSAVASNCYFYAQNLYPVSGVNMDPGYTLNLLESDSNAISRFLDYAAGDGHIPTTFEGVCPDNRTKIFFSGHSQNYHWYRQDADGNWSDKYATWGQAELTENEGVKPYEDVQNNAYEGFFCACNPTLP